MKFRGQFHFASWAACNLVPRVSRGGERRDLKTRLGVVNPVLERSVCFLEWTPERCLVATNDPSGGLKSLLSVDLQ